MRPLSWWLPSGSPAAPVLESVAVLVATGAAALRILQAWPGLPPGSRRAWSLLGPGQLTAFGLAFLLDYLGALLPAVAPLATAAGIMRLIAFGLAASSMFFFPYESRHDPTRFRFILDALISCGVVVALIFQLLVRPLSLRQPNFDWLLPVAFASADAILLVILSNFALARSIPRSLAVFLGAGWTALLASDYARASLVLMGGYAPGDMLGVGWLVAPLLVAGGALHERDRALHAEAGPPRPGSHDMGMQFQRVMPIALELVLVWFVLADWRLRGELFPLAFWMSSVLGAVLVARLGIRAGEARLDQYWRLFNNLPDPSFILDSRGQVRLGNPALERLLDPGTAEDAEHLLIEIFDGVSVRALSEAAQAGKSLEVIHRRSGRPFLITLSPLSGGYRRPLYAAVAHDMTDQKRQSEAISTAYGELRQVHGKLEEMNAQLEQRVDERTHSLQAAYRQLEDQNRALQRLDQMKTEFVNLVSHELRAPLTTVSGGVELMLKRRVGAAESDVLHLIQAEVARLTSFVEGILNVAALEAGRYVLHPRPLDVQEIVDQSVSAWQSRCLSAGGSRCTSPRICRPSWQMRLWSAAPLRHLIDNALKYAPGSPVNVAADLVDHAVQLEVRDLGPGVPPDQQHLLFQRFERLNASDSQAVYGHGLGLYLSRRLLGAMGSDLRFESPPDGGIRFLFSLDVAP